MLHMEVVLGMSLSEHGPQSSPMLQQLLKHADRYGIDAVMPAGIFSVCYCIDACASRIGMLAR